MPSFNSHSFVPGGVLQTVMGSLFPGKPSLPERESHLVTISPNCNLMVCKIDGKSTSGPIILLAHGMGGSSESAYMKRIAYKLRGEGVGAVYMMNQRGSGLNMGKHDRLWNGGSSDDLGHVVEYISEMHPDSAVLLVGFSLSGNVVLKYLGEGRPIPGNVEGAFAVSPPIDLKLSTKILSENGVNLIFNRYYLNLLHRQVDAIAKHFPLAFSLKKPAKNMLDFDTRYTALAAGYKNVEEYYSKCSAKQFLAGITVPTIVLSSRDDPFVPVRSIEEADKGALVRCMLPFEGGHMGYIAKNKTPWNDFRWMDFAIVEWAKKWMNSEVLVNG